MHSKPTHKILYHCPESLYPKLATMAVQQSKSKTAIITIALDLLWAQHCREIDETLDRISFELENKNAD